MILRGGEPFFYRGGSHGVLLVHGFTSVPAEMLLLGCHLHDLGYTVLGVRLAGHGTTPKDLERMSREDWYDSVCDGYALLDSCCERISVETVDACVGRVVDAALEMGGIAMITADHGNAEQMLQPDGSPMTAHTTNRVPFILCGAGTELREGRLADIAPTILDVMGLACPPEMDGKTLIVR